MIFTIDCTIEQTIKQARLELPARLSLEQVTEYWHKHPDLCPAVYRQCVGICIATCIAVFVLYLNSLAQQFWND